MPVHDSFGLQMIQQKGQRLLHCVADARETNGIQRLHHLRASDKPYVLDGVNLIDGNRLRGNAIALLAFMGERMTQAAARGNSGYRGVSEPLLFRRFAFGNPAVFGAKETNSTGINSEL